MQNKINNILKLYEYDEKQRRLEELNYLLFNENYNYNFVEFLKEKSQLENDLYELQEIKDLYDNCREMSEIEEFEEEYTYSMSELNHKIENLEFRKIFSGKDDEENSIITIHSGAGGTEACDWAQMLFRMYAMFCKSMNFNIEILDEQIGDVAGIKSITFKSIGEYSYGYFKAEAGVHRLIRNSPYDANNKRHTSFASVDVLADINTNIDIQINSSDLKWDYFRGSGAGGQHRNKTETAVRIVHIPTGITAQCQNERSKTQNEQNALKILKLRLYNNELLKINEEKKNIDKDKLKINFGSQIRTYTLQPFQLIKDHRTNLETGNVNRFLDGDIKNFIIEYLKLGEIKNDNA